MMDKKVYLLGIDSGLTNIKAAIYNAEGNEICNNILGWEVEHPSPG